MKFVYKLGNLEIHSDEFEYQDIEKIFTDITSAIYFVNTPNRLNDLFNGMRDFEKWLETHRKFGRL